jgi:cell division transport system ATP-binding protein
MATHDHAIVDAMRRRVVELERGRIVRDESRGVYETLEESVLPPGAGPEPSRNGPRSPAKAQKGIDETAERDPAVVDEKAPVEASKGTGAAPATATVSTDVDEAKDRS